MFLADTNMEEISSSCWTWFPYFLGLPWPEQW